MVALLVGQLSIMSVLVSPLVIRSRNMLQWLNGFQANDSLAPQPLAIDGPPANQAPGRAEGIDGATDVCLVSGCFGIDVSITWGSGSGPRNASCLKAT